jgi:hypothetical protein
MEVPKITVRWSYMGLGEEECMHQQYEDECPVTRRGCYLHRQAINSRVGGIEKDITEIKFEQRNMRECMDRFFDLQTSKWNQLFLIVIAILILVAAGRVFDVDAWLGLMP